MFKENTKRKIPIWRVENLIGEGCYRKKPWTYSILKRHDNPATHPSPVQDIRISRKPKPEEISGFITETQARRWFNDEELQNLLYMGYTLKKVFVEKVTAIGSCQVLAIK